ncbi:MAG: hypothetical protein ABJB74_15745, partial [Gemmatimonas sp.]
MNDDKHAPTDEFVEYLARDTMRRLRYESRFSEAPRVNHSRSRYTTLAVAAGVVITLSTGMVLGASANYASAEVLPNGTTTIPSRPAFAILPIKNALSAIGCTQSVEHAVAAATSPKSASLPSTVVPPIAEPAAIDQVSTPTLSENPNRALIALLARQHQPAVVRGDTISQYIVMVLDAAQNYLWSTHGNGGVAVDAGGDLRTPVERAEYNRVYAAELQGTSRPISIRYSYAADTVIRENFAIRRDSATGRQIWNYRDVITSDTNASGLRRLSFRVQDSTRVIALQGVAGRGGAA